MIPMKRRFKQLIKTLQPSIYVVTDQHDERGIDRRLVSYADKRSHVAEQYRVLQTHLYALTAQKTVRTIVITSGRTAEGKTLTCCNLAITLGSDTSKKTVLVDCDLRKPDIHTIFNIKKAPGVSDIINGKCDVSDLVKSPVIDNLFVIPAGSTVSNPSELLRRTETKELFERLKSSFDYVIIDTPPVMPVSDSRIVGALCDALIVVARSDKTTKKAAKETSWLLETARTKPLACILTGFQAPFFQYTGYSPYYVDPKVIG